MTRVIMEFAKDESGATAIEYGLIAAGISVAIIDVVNASAPNCRRRSARSARSLLRPGSKYPAAKPGAWSRILEGGRIVRRVAACRWSYWTAAVLANGG